MKIHRHPSGISGTGARPDLRLIASYSISRGRHLFPSIYVRACHEQRSTTPPAHTTHRIVSITSYHPCAPRLNPASPSLSSLPAYSSPTTSCSIARSYLKWHEPHDSKANASSKASPASPRSPAQVSQQSPSSAPYRATWVSFQVTRTRSIMIRPRRSQPSRRVIRNGKRSCLRSSLGS